MSFIRGYVSKSNPLLGSLFIRNLTLQKEQVLKRVVLIRRSVARALKNKNPGSRDP